MKTRRHSRGQDPLGQGRWSPSWAQFCAGEGAGPVHISDGRLSSMKFFVAFVQIEKMLNSLDTYRALWALCYIGLVVVMGLLITLGVQYRAPLNSVYAITV